MMTNDTSISAWRTKRQWRIALNCVLLLLLCASALFLHQARQHLAQSRAEATALRFALDEARTRQAERQIRAAVDEAARQLQQQAALRGIGVDGWARRLVELRPQAMPRVEANEFLLSIARTPERYFDFESFELSVRGNETGIFDPFVHAGAPLLLGARGTLVFRTGSLP